MSNASEAWKQELSKLGAYEHHCNSFAELRSLKKVGRVWKRIFRVTGIKPPARLFELGCGGGRYLASLALLGFDVHGIDVSGDVAGRAKNYLKEVNAFQPISASVEVADIFSYEASHETYDMCFHFGVIEHFLDDAERRLVWGKLKDLTKPGGYIVSVFPNGQHFMRSMVRKNRLAGYNVPEIDYSCQLHEQEFNGAGLHSVKVLTHSYFSFLSHHPSELISKLVYPPFFVGSNILIPMIPLPGQITEKWAQTLIAIGQK